MKKILILLLVLSGFAYSQEGMVAEADQKFDRYHYIDAIRVYEKAFEKGYKTDKMLMRLGDAYFFNAKYTEANKWYTELFTIVETVDDPEYYHRYSLTLLSVGESELSEEYTKKYYDSRGIDKENIQKYKDRVQQEQRKGSYELCNLENVNSEFSDYGSVVFNNNLVFTSTRGGSKKMKWNEQSYSSLYTTNIDSVYSVMGDGNNTQLKGDITSIFNESTPVFTSDGKVVYFTRNNYIKKKGYSSDRTILLKIYKANINEEGEFTDVVELPFNSNEYSTAHPALSPDEKFLYFVSDMPGTLGESDIWKVEIFGNGKYSTPINLGENINTTGRESFPFLMNNTLYFSSMGRLGYGGMDIFRSEINEEGEYQEPINMGEPINSKMDDFGFYKVDDKIGFLSSNREGGKGDDDIYQFIFNICEYFINGYVYDIDTGERLSEVILTIDNTEEIVMTKNEENGTFSIKEYCFTELRIKAEKDEYSTNEVVITTGEESGIINDVKIGLKRNKMRPKPGDNLNEVLEIPNLYFDLDKWNIRPDAEREIAKVLEVMLEYPEMVVEIASHTDSRASHAYNERLSDRRANSTRNWLIQNGIEPNRLIAKGYGENQLVNKCADGVYCSEEDHQLNRRSIFTIISMD